MIADIIKFKLNEKWYMAKVSLNIMVDSDSCVMKIIQLDQIENTGDTTIKKIKNIFKYSVGNDGINFKKYSSIIKKIQEKIIIKYKINKLIYN
jgi:hypothetical protein